MVPRGKLEGNSGKLQHRQLVQFDLLVEQIHINRAFLVIDQDKSPGVPALRHVVRHVNHCDTGQPRHLATVSGEARPTRISRGREV